MSLNKNKFPAIVFFSTLSSMLLSGGVFILWTQHPQDPWQILFYMAIPVSVLSLLLIHLLALRPLRKNLLKISKQFNQILDDETPEIFDAEYQGSACDNELVELCTSAENLWQTAHATQQHHELLQSIFDNSLDAIIVSSLKTHKIIDCNPKARFMLGYSKKELIECEIEEIARYKDGQSSNFRKQILDKGYAWSDEMILLTKGGKELPVEVSASPLGIDDGKQLVSFIRDISERKAADERISHLAYHDSLTNLPNRTLLSDRLTRAIMKAKRAHSSGAVMFLDLDKFKRINDSLGHDTGDQLLIEVADRLRETLREDDTITRLGGDEFVVVIENIGGTDDLVLDEINHLAEKLRDRLAIPYQLAGQDIHVTSSIGISIFPRQADEVTDLLRHADTAMYNAKENGRDKVAIFDPTMEATTINRLELENQIRIAMDSGQFAVYYQPIVEIETDNFVGAEALLRWIHPEQGLLTPADFFSSLENSRLLMRIDDWVLEETIRMAEQITNAQTCPHFKMISVNVSSIQFHQPQFIDKVRRTLDAHQLSANILQLEVTEPTIQQDLDDSELKLNQLKQLGVRLAVDRFGVGYSSMSWLKKLPLDMLKLDRSFIAGIGKDKSDEIVIDTALTMSRHMNLMAIAEGVETEEQLAFLKEKKCRYYQGYLASAAIPENEFLDNCSTGY